MKRNSKRKDRLSKGIQISAATLALTSSILLAYPSIANDGDPQVTESTNQSAAPKELGREDSSLPVISMTMQVQTVAAEADNCANLDNPDGLGAAQKDAYQDRITMAGVVINTDKLFDVANNNGCFNALSNFPNLSVAIPSLTSIANALKKTMVDYATRKVCNAVNEALEEVVGPINTSLEKLSKSGQLDMSGRFNKALSKKMYEIDPELGRVATRPETEHKWNVGDLGKLVGEGTGESGTGSGSSNGSGSGSSNGSGGTNGGRIENATPDFNGGNSTAKQQSTPTNAYDSMKESVSSFFQ